VYISPNKEYPRHIGDVQIAHPDYKEGQPLPEGWEQVEESPIPTAPQGKVVYEVFPVKVDGVWRQQFAIRDTTDDEVVFLQLEQIRRKVATRQPLTEEEALLLVSE
jgi:hypothetical protein